MRSSKRVDKGPSIYLAHSNIRQRIAGAGYERVTAGRHTCLDHLGEIVRTAEGTSA